MTDDPVTTRLEVVADGESLDLDFQEYWVGRGAAGEVKAIRYSGAERARPAPGVIEAIEGADRILLCPSNPVASIFPILAVPGVRESLSAKRARVAGVSPIVGGAPLRGMADRLMPALGLEVTAYGAAEAYRGLLAGWAIDERDAPLRERIESDLDVRVGVTDTIMSDDEASERLARHTLELLG